MLLLPLNFIPMAKFSFVVPWTLRLGPPLISSIKGCDAVVASELLSATSRVKTHP